MKASEIRKKYLEFFVSKGHVVIPPALLIPENDATTLFTGSGMQPMIPYLLGATHPLGVRLTNSQPCFRTDDIESVGDNRHTCMFEMLGNWSLGDYFKKEQISWMFEFLTKIIGLDPHKLYVTCFIGAPEYNISKDTEAARIWQKLFTEHGIKAETADIGSEANGYERGMKEGERIFYYDGSKNWWSRNGGPQTTPIGDPCGPDSEMFYEFTEVEHDPKYGTHCHPNCDCGRFLEIGNNVFMGYKKVAEGQFKPLKAPNIDFGAGFERLVAASQNMSDVFKTDMFSSIVQTIELSSGKKYEGEYMSPMRVIADHLRAAVFMSAQGIIPSNKLQGYFMRRLLRRAAVRGRKLGGDIKSIFSESIPEVVKFYADAGFISGDSLDHVQSVIADELDRFDKVLRNGLRDIEKRESKLDEQIAFDLYQSVGFPFEITKELVAEKGVELDENKFNELLNKHKEGSRTASAGMFKGGLADQGETTTKYHTATHLLHQALRDVLGDEVGQAGSNINAERLRFDYTYRGKPTDEQVKKVESIINDKIKLDLPVIKSIEDKGKAIDDGARSFFREKYPDKVSVYTIGLQGEKWYSKELCGGPHVERTGVIGSIKIVKDENLGTGLRRIYAKLT